MTLPDNFSHWEHLQDMLRREHNKTVRAYFKDLGGVDWAPDISSSRGAIRVACTMDDNDTADMTMLRMYLFHQVLGYGRKQLANVYGLPKFEKNEGVEYKPKIVLVFEQDSSAVPENLSKLTAEISFRMMDHTSEDLTPSILTPIAAKISNVFTDAGRGITYDKGKIICYYKDKIHGYELRIYALNKPEGIEVIKKVLSIRNHTYNDDFLSISDSEKNSINNPTGTQKIYGKNRKKPTWRRTGKVRFRYAYADLWGMTSFIHLVDTRGVWADALAE
jgi:hypothetical protein